MIDTVIPNSYYMRIWERDYERDKGIATFEPDFSSNNLVHLGESVYVRDIKELKARIEHYLFERYGCQFNKDEFTCVETEYGYEYEGLFIMDEDCKIKQDNINYTHMIYYEVEVYYYPENNGMKSIRR